MDNPNQVDQKVKNNPLLPKIIQEISQAQEGTLKRQELIKKFESESKKKDRKEHKLIVYIARMGHPRNANPINPDDIAPIGSILQSFSGADVIDLIIHSPGGDGNTAEKIVDMCRSYLPTKGQFKVIVPNKAKSAATLIALGADEIIMGYSSELGPIDAQIPVNVSGVVQYISAQSFIDARNDLIKNTHEAIDNKKPYQAYLQLLTTIDVAFVKECERAMNFARNVGSRFLSRYMLGSMKNKKEREDLALKIADTLSSAQTYLSHGRMITAKDIASHGVLKKLKIENLDQTNVLWNIIWEIYMRSEVYLSINSNPQQIKAKLFESADSSLIAAG